MSSPSFVHLHVHSEYSVLESPSSVDALVQRAVAESMPALALTDLGNMFGAVEFYLACQSKGIKPLIGLEVYLAPGFLGAARWRKGSEVEAPGGLGGGLGGANGWGGWTTLVLLAQNYKGYQNLCRISTAGYQEGFYYKPRVDEDILRRYSEDLIVLTGGSRGLLPQTLLTEGAESALRWGRLLKEIYPDRLYVEVHRTGLKESQLLVPQLEEIGKVLNLPLVAANDVYFLSPEDQVAQEVLICIGTNKTLQDESRFRLGSDQFYMKSAAQMRELFKDLPGVCDRTLEIADRCKVQFRMKDESGKPIYHLPSFPTQEGRNLREEIAAQAYAGLRVRLGGIKGEESGEVEPNQGASVREMEDPEWGPYWKRLNYELGVIDRMGFNGYFLIVADFINWAKQEGIPVGPGRGSGAGSLVAYVLRITDLDPLPNRLLFERFLNPERISMPDFDIDFCQERRSDVIRYVTEKYGEKSVSQIITYGRLQCRAAIKDVGRVMGMTFSEVDLITKLVPEKLNITIEEALAQEPRLVELMESDPQVATVIDLARRIEGLVRHVGIHAAGVIIADGEIVRHAPLYRGVDGENVVQYDMKHSEKIGLIKFDFLGLKTLTHIHHALRLIEKNRGEKIRVEDIPIHDPGIYEIMTQGDTAGIFQFESEGITNAIKLIRPTTFFDITAINALYRPGPMAMIPDYAKRKNGEVLVEYIFEEIKDVLEETYGILVYQEQVMGVAARVAGYSLGEADMLRRAMGKKNKEEMDVQRERFLNGAKDRGYDGRKSEELFELMCRFADYGFNKSHAAAYCVVAAQTAWLKRYYPSEFYAALLSTELGDMDKVVKYVKDAQRRGLPIHPPHVNHSDYLFTVRGQGIYFGLGAIKGLGASAITAILEGREQKQESRERKKEGRERKEEGQSQGASFTSLEDFFKRVDSRKLNKKVMECLIKSGALDGLGSLHRAQMMQEYSKFLERAQVDRRGAEMGQLSFFDWIQEENSGGEALGDSGNGLGSGEDLQVMIEEVPHWTRSAALAYEKEVLGFYLSGHPLQGLDRLCAPWVTSTLDQLPALWSEHRARTVDDRGDAQPTKYNFRNRDSKKKRVVVAGFIVEKRELMTKKATRMCFARLEDVTGSCELVIFPDTYAKVESLLHQVDRPVLIGGFLEGEESQAKIIVDKIAPLEEIIGKIKQLTLSLDSFSQEEVVRLKQTLSNHPGSTQLIFVVRVPDEEAALEVRIQPTSPGCVRLSSTLLDELQVQLGRTDFILTEFLAQSRAHPTLPAHSANEEMRQ